VHCLNKGGLKFCSVIDKSSATETDESPVLVKDLKSALKAPVKAEGDTTNDESPMVKVKTSTAEMENSRELAEPKGENQPGEGKEMVEHFVGNLPSAAISEADLLLDKVFGDHIRQNPGTHLDGGIAGNALWQDYWSCLLVYPSQTYDAPKGAVGCRFIEKVAELLTGVRQRSASGIQRDSFYSIYLYYNARTL
jgi:hypothetical protein